MGSLLNICHISSLYSVYFAGQVYTLHISVYTAYVRNVPHCYNSLQAKFAHGNWQRPAWQGRFVSGPPQPHNQADDLLLACLLVERQAKTANMDDDSNDDNSTLGVFYTSSANCSPSLLPRSNTPLFQNQQGEFCMTCAT